MKTTTVYRLFSGIAGLVLLTTLVACSRQETSAPGAETAAPQGGAAAAAASVVPDYIQAAVADAARPETDTARDGYRLPGESVAFSGMKPGDKVADLLPGRGYFTRIFAKVVGSTGHVYAVQGNMMMGPRGGGMGPEGGGDAMGGPTAGSPAAGAAEAMGAAPAGGDGMAPAGRQGGPPNIDALVAEAAYAGLITASSQDLTKLSFPEPLDLVWTSLNYHDLANPERPFDRAGMNKAIFAALKPGGTYLVIDHAAAAGAGASVAGTLHRIEGATVRSEVEAAGFVFEAESEILRNPLDTHTERMDGDTIPTQSDKFVYRFRKPAA